MTDNASISQDFIAKISTNMAKGRAYVVSDFMWYKGKLYKEVKFYKRSFLNFQKEISGYAYLDANGEIVSDEILKKQLAKLGYYFEVFFDSKSKLNISRAFKERKETKRNPWNGDIDTGLNYLYKNGLEEVKPTQEAMNVFMKFKAEKDRALKELLEEIGTIKSQNQYFGDELFLKLYPTYEKILKLNFEGVKELSQAAIYISMVKNASDKKQRSLEIRLNRKIHESLMLLSEAMSYYNTLIKAYEKVLSLNEVQYESFFHKLNSERVSHRAKLVED